MPLTTRFRLGLTATHTATAPTNDLGINGTGGSIELGTLFDFSLPTGTAVGQADRVFSDTRTVTASTNDDLDLAGTLTDSFGATVTFAKVKAIFIRSAGAGHPSGANTQNFTVGAAAANGWSTLFTQTAVTMRPGQLLGAACDATDSTCWAVTAGTGDLLRIANGAGASINYDILIIGTSV